MADPDQSGNGHELATRVANLEALVADKGAFGRIIVLDRELGKLLFKQGEMTTAMTAGFSAAALVSEKTQQQVNALHIKLDKLIEALAPSEPTSITTQSKPKRATRARKRG